MKQITVKNITLMQTPESDEARELLEEAKQRFKLYILWCIPALIIGVVLLGCGIGLNNVVQIGIGSTFLVIFAISLIFFLSRRAAYLRPYIELLRIAISNDKLRHEERIRWRERARLEATEHNSSYSETMSAKTKKLNKAIDKTKSKLSASPNDADSEM